MGVNRAMTKSQIHQAYLKLAMANHPDIHGDKKVDTYVQIQEAYDQIKSGKTTQIRDAIYLDFYVIWKI